jgi:hypothetical protein
MPILPSATDGDGFSRTALHCTPNGELDWEDLRGLLARLAAVDARGQHFRWCELGSGTP